MADAVAMETRCRTYAHSVAVQKFQGQGEGKRQRMNETAEAKLAGRALQVLTSHPSHLDLPPREATSGAEALLSYQLVGSSENHGQETISFPLLSHAHRGPDRERSGCKDSSQRSQ